MRVLLNILAMLAVMVPLSGWACSFAPGFAQFNPKPAGFGSALPPGPKLPPPEINLESLTRGYDDGDYASCSDAGILVFSVPGELGIGYEFRIVEGSFPDAVIPDYPVRPAMNEPDKLRFVWLDYQGGPIEPIDVVIEVRAVSGAGDRGESTLLEIYHPGGSGSADQPL